ncbi:MAG: GntP family permease [Candidatus Glassbacteria bacterium]|nr:GntP family permease [Candidatus Glassbacteria bacterium]
MGGLALGAVLLLLVAGIVLASARWRVDAFLLLVLSALIFGLCAGLGLEGTLENIKQGFGSTLGGVGLVIIFGAMIGVFLERTGASSSIAGTMLRAVGEKRAGLSLSLTGFLVSIPVFCDSGFIVLVPLVRAIAAKTAVSTLALAVCLATGLYATHCLVPPTPGPVAAAEALGADLGRVILLGLPVALVLALAGYFWAMRFASWTDRSGDPALQRPAGAADDSDRAGPGREAPGAFRSMLPIIVPLVLITLGSLSRLESAPFGSGTFCSLISGMGHPVFALGLGLVFSFPLSGAGDPHMKWVAAGITSCAMVLAVTAAGGAFGRVIRESELSVTLQEVLGGWRAGVLVPFVLAAAIKSAQGSSTVSLITTAAIMQPLLGPLGLAGSPWGPALTVVAIGCGSMTVSHANDSYFWVVSQMAGIPVPDAYRAYTTATALMGLSGAVVTLGMAALLL